MKDLISDNFLNVNEKKQGVIKQCEKYLLFYPIFRKALSFFIRVLQTVELGISGIFAAELKARFPYNRSCRYYRRCRRKTCFSDSSDIWKHTLQR